MTTRNNRILFILHFPPPIHGASLVGKYIRESQLINTYFEAKYLNLGIANSLKEIGKSSVAKYFRFIIIIINTIFFILKYKPQLVYITLTAKGRGFYKDALIVLIIKMLGRKIVYHLHNKGVSSRQDNLLDDLLYKLVFKNTDVILLSNKLYTDIQKYVTNDRVHICPNGIPKINIDKYEQDSVSSSAEINILFLSNLMKAKGTLVFLEACRILKEGDVQFNGKLIGAESDVSLNELQMQIKKLGIEKLIKYLGPIYSNDKNKYLAIADIFVFPSLNECFPLVLLEAMQFKLPIVATQDGGIPDIIKDQHNGLLIKKGDPIELAEKLEILIKDKELRKQMGEKGRTVFLNNFTLDQFEKNIVGILDKIINNN